ncbi:MAG: hypothetical protein R3F34_07740 [Planctomycetota bacterium]
MKTSQPILTSVIVIASVVGAACSGSTDAHETPTKAVETSAVTNERVADAATQEAAAAKPAAAPVVDAPLAQSRRDLLRRAYDVASSIPTQPHHKTRGKYQEMVVEAALELDQPATALDFARGIENWRRGAAIAEYALYLAENHPDSDLAALLDEARQVAVDAAKAEEQEWRVNTIRAKMAKVKLRLGDDDGAQALIVGVDGPEIGEVDRYRATTATKAEATSRMAYVDEILGQGDFNSQSNVLFVCAEFHRRFYDDPDLRADLEEKITEGWGKIPLGVRLDLLFELADSAREHSDREHAVEILGDAHAMMDAAHWLPQDHARILGRMAKELCAAGELSWARTDADQGLAVYQQEAERITNIERTEALLPLAEVYVDLGDTATARKVYALAVEAAVVNPNSCPRAEDLTQILLSLASKSFDPGAEIVARIGELAGALSDPW